MSSALITDPLDVDAILGGAGEPLAELLRRQPAEAMPLATAFHQAWSEQSALHEDLQAACAPLFAALAALDPALWAAAPAHAAWRVLAAVQLGGAGYQPELGRAGEKILAELVAAAALAQGGDWSGAAAALEGWWTQEQQRLGRLEQRLIDTERGQLRSRRAQLMAARLLNQTMAGRHFAREVSDYLQREWFQELQWAALQFGGDSEEWRRRAQLTQRLVDSLQPAGADEVARQELYALIPEVGSELAAVLGERAHDRALLEQQLALIESQHLLLLRGREPLAAPFQLIANDDPWLSTTIVSASLMQRVAALEPGNWFRMRDSDVEQRIKLALKLDDSTQLLFVNRLGVKARQQSFEEFAYLLSVGAALQMPAPDIARQVLRALLVGLAQRSVDDQHARAEAQRLVDVEARLRVEARAKAMAEARALAEAQARAEAEEAAQRALEERAAQEALERQQREEQEREQQRLLEQQRVEEQRQLEELQAQQRLRELEEQQRRERDERERQEKLEQAQRTEREAQARAVEQPPPVARPAVVDEQKLRAARREAGLLPIGSWIELRDAAGVTRRLKLAVKLSSSGKLILVDRDGVRQAEYERDAFAELLMDGSAQILNQGPRFEDTLAKVVDSMRRDRAPRE
jgi:hypothetical protein